MVNTVLVVDDEPDFLELLDLVLTPPGYHVVTCPVPTEAQRKAVELQPAVAIVDLRMPDFSGWTVIEQLKADPSTSSIAVVVCTAAVTEVMQYRARLREWGCGVLVKPFELEDLVSLVASMMTERVAS